MSLAFDSDLALRRLVVAAGQAPSVHNTQPWRFRVPDGELIELFADLDRRLRVGDPRGRNQLVSCGAALFNLRLAVRTGGRRPMVWLLPNPEEEPELLAAVRMGAALPASAEQLELYNMIPIRRTSRRPYFTRTLPPAVLVELRLAASREGARLVPLDRHRAADTLEHAALAEDELSRDHAYLAELAAWTMPRARHDGVPGYTLGPPRRSSGTPRWRRAHRSTACSGSTRSRR
ncbi:hypothetical protein [Nonomuraea basaltis]|uniref:hypothetical protein n=1 Tax=Nonomuraea basaltis TaxID=2495887 RepID=UPI001F0F9DF5|nr:hypothetical protein [Nonomuraea basaltis]